MSSKKKKVAGFVWKLIQNRLPTRDNLICRGVLVFYHLHWVCPGCLIKLKRTLQLHIYSMKIWVLYSAVTYQLLTVAYKKKKRILKDQLFITIAGFSLYTASRINSHGSMALTRIHGNQFGFRSVIWVIWLFITHYLILIYMYCQMILLISNVKCQFN